MRFASAQRRALEMSAFLRIPEPYDFELSTARFRAGAAIPRTCGRTGRSGAPSTAARSGSRRRRAASTSSRSTPRRRRSLQAARRRVRPRRVLRLRRDGAGARRASCPTLRGLRPPLAPDPFESLVTSITAQQVSLHAAFAIRAPADRALRRAGRARVRVPDARARRDGGRGRARRPRLLAAQGRVRPSASRAPTSTSTRSRRLAGRRGEGAARRRFAASASGRPSGSSRATSRGRARGPPATSACARRSAHFYGDLDVRDRATALRPVPEPVGALPARRSLRWRRLVNIRSATPEDVDLLMSLVERLERELPPTCRMPRIRPSVERAKVERMVERRRRADRRGGRERGRLRAGPLRRSRPDDGLRVGPLGRRRPRADAGIGRELLRARRRRGGGARQHARPARRRLAEHGRRSRSTSTSASRRARRSSAPALDALLAGARAAAREHRRACTSRPTTRRPSSASCDEYLPRLVRGGVGDGRARPRVDRRCASSRSTARRCASSASSSRIRFGVTVVLALEEGAVVRFVIHDRGRMVDEYLSVPEYYGPLPPGDVLALRANPTVVVAADRRRGRARARSCAQRPTAGRPAAGRRAVRADRRRARAAAVITLYDAARCPYCARVRIVLAEKGDRVRAGGDRSLEPAGVALREEPAGKVPVLEEDTLVLPESAVIMEYLEERYPEPALLPADPAQRALERLRVFRFDDELGDDYYAFRRGDDERARRAPGGVRSGARTASRRSRICRG